jgi:hypothetical protein
MASDRPDPSEFFELAQRMLREWFGRPGSDDDDPWAEATRPARERSEGAPGPRPPSPARQRENLTFALGTRAVEALEDLALNVAAIRQRLERTDPQASGQQASGTQPSAPQPSAPHPSAPQPSAPQPSSPQASGPQLGDAGGSPTGADDAGQ